MMGQNRFHIIVRRLTQGELRILRHCSHCSSRSGELAELRASRGRLALTIYIYKREKIDLQYLYKEPKVRDPLVADWPGLISHSLTTCRLDSKFQWQFSKRKLNSTLTETTQIASQNDDITTKIWSQRSNRQNLNQKTPGPRHKGRVLLSSMMWLPQQAAASTPQAPTRKLNSREGLSRNLNQWTSTPAKSHSSWNLS